MNQLKNNIQSQPKKWILTGAAGFIGSHICETLLKLNQEVLVVDNLSTGSQDNIDHLSRVSSEYPQSSFLFLKESILETNTLIDACSGYDYIIHNAALGSVPRSMELPLLYFENNITGTASIFEVAKKCNISRVVFASSSSVYGDSPALPKKEEAIGEPLSPYALSKKVNEISAANFSRCFGIEYIGLRYFNVFGPRQNPNGAYAAVIPRWIQAMMDNKATQIYGDGETSRDFSFVENVVFANLLAATTESSEAVNNIYNIACHGRTTLTELHKLIVESLINKNQLSGPKDAEYVDFKPGDIRHSFADIDKATQLLGYSVQCEIEEGLSRTIQSFI